MASSTLDTEAGGAQHKAGGDSSGYTTAATAHAVDTDSWQQVGLLLVTGFNCAYVLSFSNLMMVPLGWGWGAACLLLLAAAAWYANWLLAGLHVVDGQRFIRYRDLMGFVFGRKMYYLTWFLQFTTLLLGSMGFILLGGRALKAISAEFTQTPPRLQWFIAATGFVYFAFAYFVPTISAMRNWLATSAALTVTFDVALLAVLVKDGAAGLRHPRDGGGEGVQRAGRRGGHPGVQHLGAAPGDPVDAAEAVGGQHAAGAGAAVHGGRGGVLRGQRGRLLGVRSRRVRVPAQPALRPALGLRAHQRHRLPPEHRLAAPVHGADPRGHGHGAAEAGGGHVLALQHDATALRQGGAVRGQRLRHRALPIHGRLRQPLRLLRALPAHLHVPQHDHPQDQRGVRREVGQAVALGHHRRLHGRRRRHLRRRRQIDPAQRQRLPLLRRHLEHDDPATQDDDALRACSQP